MNHVNTFSTKGIAIVLDTSALLSKYYRLIPRLSINAYTTHSANNEVKDHENRVALDEAIELGMIELLTPRQDCVDIVKEAATRIGCVHKLSSTDLEVAALALQLQASYSDVIVVTDDYELQNLLAYLRISFRPLRTRGIRRPRTFVAMCPVCGYVPSRPNEITCPFCGVKVSRRSLLSENSYEVSRHVPAER